MLPFANDVFLQDCETFHFRSSICFNLAGVIPYEVGNLQTLEVLNLRFNSLKGSIPTRIFNISTLRVLSIVSNSLSGNLPSDMGLGVPNLEELYLALITSVDYCIVPDSISNSSKLTHVEFARNRLTRPIYIVFGNLQFLECLVLFDNNLTNESSSAELSFFTTLTECRYLRKISVANNPLTGILPVSIGNLSSSIEKIYAGGYKMMGRIPKTVGNLSNLRVLGLQENPLSGSIPSTVKGLQMLQGLSIEGCKSSNRITPYVPHSLWSLKDLLGFILPSNFLTGSLPLEIGQVKVATWIDLSLNQFSNNIPSRIGDLENLNHLSLAYNNFEGAIPSNGPFKNFTSESFISSDALCGSSRFHVPACQTPLIHRSRTKEKEKVPNGTNLLSLTAKGRISYYELLQATNGYDEIHLLGSFGSVYKGILANGICVAIKVFNLQLEYSFKSFTRECEVLRSLRHRNLTKVIGVCSNDDFKGLLPQWEP
nr:putative receptor-like protein kinase At3g47110 [Coffea arabica]